LKSLNWTGWFVFAVVVVVWEVAGRASPAVRYYIPPVSQISGSLFQIVLSGEIASDVATTLTRFVVGYLIAAVMAVAAGIFLGYFPLAHSYLDMLVELLRPMPSVAIIPVAILLLGIGDAMIVAVTVYASVWPVLINTIDGVRHIEPTLIYTGRTFGLGRWQILTSIILPAASPYIVTGLRVSLAIALILVTTAEMVAGTKGLGFYILDEERSLRNSNMYAGIVLVAALGYLLNRLFLLVESILMKWKRGLVAEEVQ
jgi:ABC-type nitrate/sulfonate/bicarbonate transport system permease component